MQLASCVNITHRSGLILHILFVCTSCWFYITLYSMNNIKIIRPYSLCGNTVVAQDC
jgi:hypothetical protein